MEKIKYISVHIVESFFPTCYSFVAVFRKPLILSAKNFLFGHPKTILRTYHPRKKNAFLKYFSDAEFSELESLYPNASTSTPVVGSETPAVGVGLRRHPRCVDQLKEQENLFAEEPRAANSRQLRE